MYRIYLDNADLRNFIYKRLFTFIRPLIDAPWTATKKYRRLPSAAGLEKRSLRRA